MTQSSDINSPLLPPDVVVRRFFDAWSRRDTAALTAALHPQVSFSDPLFTDVRGVRVALMWTNRLSESEDLMVAHEILFADERKAQVRWQAQYILGARKVAHEGLSTLSLWDNLIVRQVDEYDFLLWARQAYGPIGWLLGATEGYQAACQRRARKDLERFAASGTP